MTQRKKSRHPISREFFPFDRFEFSLNPRAIALSRQVMGIPRFVWHDPDLNVTNHVIPGYQDGKLEVLIITPKRLSDWPSPCFVDIHGGGFVFDAAFNHYRLAMAYAKGAQCIVALVRYRLAPAHPFPVPQEDSYCALKWVHDHASELDVNPLRIGVGGDSAGGTLAVTSCLMARDRNAAVKPLFQLLIYPWLDGRNDSDSFHRFTDTPMWNSTLSKEVGPLINPDPSMTPLAYRSPVEAESLMGLPPAYVEVAEFDCLHDDGVLYVKLLRDAGVEAELHETRGTIHGFDAKVNAPTTQKMVAKRIDFMRRHFKRAMSEELV